LAGGPWHLWIGRRRRQLRVSASTCARRGHATRTSPPGGLRPWATGRLAGGSAQKVLVETVASRRPSPCRRPSRAEADAPACRHQQRLGEPTKPSPPASRPRAVSHADSVTSSAFRSSRAGSRGPRARPSKTGLLSGPVPKDRQGGLGQDHAEPGGSAWSISPVRRRCDKTELSQLAASRRRGGDGRWARAHSRRPERIRVADRRIGRAGRSPDLVSRARKGRKSRRPPRRHEHVLQLAIFGRAHRRGPGVEHDAELAGAKSRGDDRPSLQTSATIARRHRHDLRSSFLSRAFRCRRARRPLASGRASRRGAGYDHVISSRDRAAAWGRSTRRHAHRPGRPRPAAGMAEEGARRYLIWRVRGP